MRLEADNGRVVVLSKKEEVGRLGDPTQAKRSPYATVTSVGKDADTSSVAGDTVVVGLHAGQPIELDGETYLVLNASEIGAICRS